MGYLVLSFLVGQQPNKQFVSNRIIRHIGGGKKPSKEHEVFVMDKVIQYQTP
jgi:hypothetical protein